MLADLRARRERRGGSRNCSKALNPDCAVDPYGYYSSALSSVLGLSSLDEEGRDLLAAQVQMDWRHAPEDLVKLALTPDRVNRLSLREWIGRRSGVGRVR